MLVSGQEFFSGHGKNRQLKKWKIAHEELANQVFGMAFGWGGELLAETRAEMEIR